MSLFRNATRLCAASPATYGGSQNAVQEARVLSLLGEYTDKRECCRGKTNLVLLLGMMELLICFHLNQIEMVVVLCFSKRKIKRLPLLIAQYKA